MKRILAIAIVSFLLAGCGQTGDKVTMSVSEYEALKEAAGESVQVAESSSSSVSEQIDFVEDEKVDFNPADLIGEFEGTFHTKRFDDTADMEVETDKKWTVYIETREDGTWTLLVEGETRTGKWESIMNSGKVLNLLVYSDYFDEYEDRGWALSFLKGKTILHFFLGTDYEVEMKKL